MLDDVSDSNELVATQEALSLLSLSAELQRSLLRVLAAILHLGNIAIFQKDDDSEIKVGSTLVSMVLPKQVQKSYSASVNMYTLLYIRMCLGNVYDGNLVSMVLPRQGPLVKP